jgi:TetR/AcrR family transcriptional regulator, cholesterol catabolism regulator
MGEVTKPTATMTKKQKRLDEIIEVASILFMEKGYEQTSIQDIAEKVGVLKGSLYYYIDAKEDILYWVIRSNHEDLHASMVVAVDGHDYRPMEQVHAFLDNHMEFVLHNVGRSASFHFEFRSLSQERQDEIVQLRRNYEQSLTDLLQAAQQDGDVCPDLTPATASRALLSMLNSVHRWYRPKSDREERSIAAHYTQMSLRAVACSPEEHEPGHVLGVE